MQIMWSADSPRPGRVRASLGRSAGARKRSRPAHRDLATAVGYPSSARRAPGGCDTGSGSAGNAPLGSSHGPVASRSTGCPCRVTPSPGEFLQSRSISARDRSIIDEVAVYLDKTPGWRKERAGGGARYSSLAHRKYSHQSLAGTGVLNNINGGPAHRPVVSPLK